MQTSRISPLSITIVVLTALGIGIYFFAPKDAVAPLDGTVATTTPDGGVIPDSGSTASPTESAASQKPSASVPATPKPTSPTQPKAQAPAAQSTTKAAFRSDDANIPACPAGRPVFSVVPMNDADFYALRPLGFHSLPEHIFGAKHMAMTVNLPGEKKVNRKVFFPADAAVTEIVAVTYASGASGYQVTFWPCPTFKSYFMHLGELSDKLSASFTSATKSCVAGTSGSGVTQKCTAKLSLAVKAGDQVGVNDGLAGIDFGAVDYAKTPSKFANPARYDLDYAYYAPAYDYFAPTIQAALGKKVASYDGMIERTATPKGGTIAHDISGTAQGNWFTHDGSIMKGSEFDQYLHLGHDYIDPKFPVMALGSGINGTKMGLYSFPVLPTGNINRDFKEILPGAIYCYERFSAGRTTGKLPLSPQDGVILMRMPSDKVLFLEQQGSAGTNCQSLAPWKMTDHATIFER